MAKSHGPMSKMYGSMVDGKNEELGEPQDTSDDEVSEGEGSMEGIAGLTIDKGANGYSVKVHKATKEGHPQSQSLPHFFSTTHPAAHHIHSILKHTRKK